MNAWLKNRITGYSFILTVFVIWLHAGECLITSIPGQIAVPGFFLLSGFLFFVGFGTPGTGSSVPFSQNGTEEPVPGVPLSQNGTAAVPDEPKPVSDVAPEAGNVSLQLLRQKLQRRGKSLVVPYLLWNLIYFLICLVMGEAQGSEFFQAVFFYRCNPVFWYLYQLILITVLTPLIYFFIRKKAVGIAFLLAVLLPAVQYNRVHQILPWFPVNFDALFYYSCGAFSSLHLAFPAEKGLRTSRLLLGSSLLFLFFTWLTGRLNADWINLGIIGQRLFGALSLWFLLGLIPEFKIYPWMTISFFVYATHYLIIRAVWKAEGWLGLGENESLNVLIYLVMPVICVSASYAVYLWMKKKTPKLLGLLTGGRGWQG